MALSKVEAISHHPHVRNVEPEVGDVDLDFGTVRLAEQRARFE